MCIPRSPTIDRLSTDYRPTVDRLSTDYRPTLDRLSTDYRPPVDRYIDRYVDRYCQSTLPTVNKILKIKKCEWTTLQPWFNDELKDWPNFVYHNEILLRRGSVPLFYNNWGREQCLLYQGFHHNYRGSLYQRSTVMSVVCLSKKFFNHRSSHFFEYPKKTQH